MTTVSRPGRAELERRRAEILSALDLTDVEFRRKVADGRLVGDEWLASAEIEGIDYLLDGV